MQHFNFSRLIEKYASGFTAITVTEGHYNRAGDYVKGETVEITDKGAIISFKESKIYRSEGTLTTMDKRLFSLKPIDNALIDCTVIYNGNLYKIEQGADNSKFTGIYAYLLRYVSAFKVKDKEQNNDRL